MSTTYKDLQITINYTFDEEPIPAESIPSSNPYRLLLEYDDLHWVTYGPQPETLKKVAELADKFPGFKVNFFTAPMQDWEPISKKPGFCNLLRELIEADVVRLGLHGAIHQVDEFTQNPKLTRRRINVAEYAFEQAGLSYTKAVRAPYWQINKASALVLQEMGYTHFYDHKKKAIPGLEMKQVFVDWDLGSVPPDLKPGLTVGHGHIHNRCNNGFMESVKHIHAYIERYNPTYAFIDEV